MHFKKIRTLKKINILVFALVFLSIALGFAQEEDTWEELPPISENSIRFMLKENPYFSFRIIKPNFIEFDDYFIQVDCKNNKYRTLYYLKHSTDSKIEITAFGDIVSGWRIPPTGYIIGLIKDVSCDWIERPIHTEKIMDLDEFKKIRMDAIFEYLEKNKPKKHKVDEFSKNNIKIYNMIEDTYKVSPLFYDSLLEELLVKIQKNKIKRKTRIK